MPSGIPENASVQQMKLSAILRILAVFQLGLSIVSMFVDIMSGLMILVGAILLYVITRGRNWCTCVCYIVLCMMDMVTSIMLVGNYFAKHSHIQSEYGVILFFTMIKLPFYVISVYYAFLAYRELKALFMEMSLGAAAQFVSPPASENNRPAGNNPPLPFSGTGYRIN